MHSVSCALLAPQRLRRMMFSEGFHILYGDVGFGEVGIGSVGIGSGLERTEVEAWINKAHPRLPDPDGRRSAQLRRGQVQDA